MLDVDFTFVWVAVNIGLLYFVVKRFLFGKINAFMENRSNAIADNMAHGESFRAEGEKYATEAKQILDGANGEGKELVAKARDKANREFERIVAEAKAEAASIIAAARETAELELERAQKQLKAQVADLAIAVASKVIEENMDNERNRVIIAEFLNKEEAA